MKTNMSAKSASLKYTLLLVGIAVALMISGILISCSPQQEQEDKLPALSQQEMIKRGKFLTTVGACNDCHSPKMMTPEGPMPDTARLLSGHPQSEALDAIPRNGNWILFSPGLTAFVGPWGISYAANLTPDDTGTGSWSLEQFKTAIRKGKYKGMEGSRALLPPMPWQMYRNFSDEDLQAIFAYLQSIKPVENIVPAPVAPADVAYVGATNQILKGQ